MPLKNDYQNGELLTATEFNAVATAVNSAETKLAGIASGATANSSDATLLARANHTGTQTASTISDFSTAADARIAAAVGVSVQGYDADLASFATKTAPSGAVVGTTDSQTITSKTISGSDNTLSNIANSSLTNSAITIAGTSTSLGGSITQDTITGLSSTGIVKRTGANTLAAAVAGTDYAAPDQTMHIGTTSVAINRASAALTVAGLTLTTPRISTIHDANGAVSLDLPATASAVNYLQIGNRAAGAGPALQAAGSDSNISIQMVPKGTGLVDIYAGTGVTPTLRGTGADTNVSLTLQTRGTGSLIVRDGASARICDFNPVTSAVNRLAVTSSATGNPVRIAAAGTDTNVSLNLVPQGTGTVQANGVEVLTTTGAQAISGKTSITSTGAISGTTITGSSTIQGTRLISNIADGTAPLTVTSTTKVSNLNADRVDDYHAQTTTGANTIVVRDANNNIFADNIIPSVTSTATAGGTTTLSVASTQIQVFTGTSTQTVVLPSTSFTAGTSVTIMNYSTGTVTIQASGGTTVTTLAGGFSAVLTARVSTPTAATHWFGTVMDQGNILNMKANLTLAGTDGKTLTVSNSLTLAGTDGNTLTVPAGGGTALVSGGSLGTPSGGTLTNCTFPTLNQNTTGSAATLTTARTFRTDLASTSTASFNGSANVTPGVTGVLAVANGGTGSSAGDLGNCKVDSAAFSTVTGTAPLSFVRAWINFNGTSGSTASRASGNVTSVTRNSIGNYTVAFTTAMPDTNYSVIGAGFTGVNEDESMGMQVDVYGSGSVTVATWNAFGNLDYVFVNLAVIR